MVISKDLLLAILAMDSYSRGYGAGISDGETDNSDGLGRVGSRIGTAIVTHDAQDSEGLAEAAGFYAVAYDTEYGTVISYRGTDNPNPLDPASDIWNGWTLGAGFPQASQGRLSIEFFEAVTNTSVFDEGAGDGVIVTGHSLAGGLAGFISLLSGAEGAGFDHMPFGAAAFAAIATEALKRAEDENREIDEIDFETLQSLGMHIPDFADFSAYYVEGEINSGLRDGTYAMLLGGILGALAGPLLGPLVQAFGGAVAIGQIAAEANINPEMLSTYDWNSSWVPGDFIDINFARHSQALLVTLLFGKEWAGGSDGSPDSQRLFWTIDGVANDFLASLFSQEIAKAAGAESIPGRHQDDRDYASIMQKAIAYSALDDGELIFGDAGIRTLFDDINDIGRGYSQENRDAFLDLELFPLSFGSASIRSLITRIAVQYAGALAIHKVEQTAANSVDGVDIARGVVSVGGDGTTLALDLSSVLWRDVLATGTYVGNEKLKAVDVDVLLPYYFQQSEDLQSSIDWLLPFPQIDTSTLDALAQAGWGADDRRILDRLHFRALADTLQVVLPDRAYEIGEASGNEAHVDIYLGTNGNDTVVTTKGNDLILGGAGNDTFVLRGGRDVIVGGDGSDTIIDRINIDEAKSPDPSATDHDDVFIGGRADQGLLASFHEWLRNFVDTDIVVYSAESVASPGGYYNLGIEITDLALTEFLESEAIALTLRNLNRDIEETDILIGIDKVVTTTRRDTIRVTDSMLAAPIWIDLGQAEGGTATKNDYDLVTYEALSSGIVLVNGATQAGSPNGPISSTSSLALIAEIAGAALGIPNPVRSVIDAFETNHPLRVTGAEHVVLTAHDDTLWYGSIGGATGFLTGWPSGDDYPRFGVIDAGDGNDLIVVRSPDYIFAGEPLHPGNPDSAVAGQDLRMEIHGGDGDDRIIVVGGTGAVTVGGYGRDVIFNASAYGQLYGDTIDGVGVSTSGTQDSDVFWYWPGTFIMDAQPNDQLQLFGLPLLGGSNSVAGVYAGDGSLAIDWLLPFVFYGYTVGGQLLVFNSLFHSLGIGPEGLEGTMIVENYDFGGWKSESWGVPAAGDLGMTFRIISGQGSKEISNWHAVWGHLMTFLNAMSDYAKVLHWLPVDDPLVLDLDGDGIETVSLTHSRVHFDLDGDFFAERTGWIGADDGFLVVDVNGNGRIDDISEMFGGPGSSGFAELAAFDEDGDGYVTVGDSGFAELWVWRDLDQDGFTDDGELFSLADLGIVSLTVTSELLNATTPQGTLLRERGTFTRADGSTGNMFEAVFETDATDTIYRGEKGVAAWLGNEAVPDAKGFGSMVNLSVAVSNDFELGRIVLDAAASMTTPSLKDIREKATPVFGVWASGTPFFRPHEHEVAIPMHSTRQMRIAA